MSLDINEITKKLQDSMKIVLEQQAPELDKLNKLMASITTPQEEKNITIMETTSVLQLFEDHISIRFPTKGLAVRFYENATVQENLIKELNTKTAEQSGTIATLEMSVNDLRSDLQDRIDTMHAMKRTAIENERQIWEAGDEIKSLKEKLAAEIARPWYKKIFKW